MGRREFRLNCSLKYPTGKKVPVNFEVKVHVQIDDFSLEISMFVAEIVDDCLLGVNFLKIVNLENIFESVFENSVFRKKRDFDCSRVIDSSKKVSVVLKKLFEKESKNLNTDQKESSIARLF